MLSNNNNNDRGFTVLEVIIIILLVTGLLAWMFRLTFYTSDVRQLGYAKQMALDEAMLSGGLTSPIVDDVTNLLVSAGLSANEISVTSPQGLNPSPPLPFGQKIEIDITITTNPSGGLDNSGHVISSTDHLAAKGYTISQYEP